jgi:hypothetical protein
MPYDQMVREMVTADGKTYENGAVGFYLRDYNMPLDNMAVTTQVFLGTSMVCAQCHNHPFDKWTQMDYYQMAAHTYGMTGTNGLSNPLLAGVFGGGYGDKGAKTKGKKAKPSPMTRRAHSARHRAQGYEQGNERDPPPAALQHRPRPHGQRSAGPARTIINTPTPSRSPSSPPSSLPPSPRMARSSTKAMKSPSIPTQAG